MTEVKYFKKTRCCHCCDVCGEVADFRLSFLTPNARCNPASSGYQKDDVSWCSDAEIFVCGAHQHNYTLPPGLEWCGTFPLISFPHMGLYWHEVEFTPVTAAAGTPLGRLEYLLTALRERFPAAISPLSSASHEHAYLQEIDKLIKSQTEQHD